jgi:hypothetical protein
VIGFGFIVPLSWMPSNRPHGNDAKSDVIGAFLRTCAAEPGGTPAVMAETPPHRIRDVVVSG